MVDPDTGEVLVTFGGVVAPELQVEDFLHLRWELARAGLLELEDGFHCRFERGRLVGRFFVRSKRKTGRPTRPAPVSGAVAEDRCTKVPGLPDSCDCSVCREIDLISLCTSDTSGHL